MGDMSEAVFKQALSLAHDQLHKGNVAEAHNIIHRGLGVEDGGIDPNGPKFFNEFDRAFLTACRKNNVRAAYILFDADDPKNPRKVRILTGGEVMTLELLKRIIAAGKHAVAEDATSSQPRR
jgi:hypothetical protein